MLGLFLCIIFYLIGAFPTGYLVGRLHGVVIWEHGSGNVGATNISRVVGKKAGLMTLAGDILKGLLPLTTLSVLGDFSGQNLACLGTFLVLGHCVSIPGYLRGGKGVATALGTYLGLSPLLALSAVITFMVTMAIWRIVSLSSILSAILVPVYAMIFASEFHQPMVPWLMVISAIVIVRHHENFGRLIQGTEKRFEFKKQQLPTDPPAAANGK